ncbi:MAG: hypothetical protein QOJ90_1757 [Actinomycetota bacterium]|jgi:hypothetical protein|nr:hypothetical protein [Actinomycetota bacterium]
MRKAPAFLLLSVAVPGLSALPVISAPTPTPKPVAPHMRAVAVRGVDQALLRTAAGRASWVISAQYRKSFRDARKLGRAPSQPAILAAADHTTAFSLIGVTWRAGTGRDVTVLVRTHSHGHWGEWTALDLSDTPAASEGADVRDGTEPVYAGPSDGYQVRVDVRSGSLPADIKVNLVDPGTSRADGTVGTAGPAASASAEAARPTIYSRKDWGADESLRSGPPTYMSTIKAGFVHHTAGTNGYSAADVPRIIRGVYAYHTLSNGWSDIGYNYLVDRFGRLWEGRWGGIDRAVKGAHTGGFNQDTFAVSAIGDYGKVAAPAAMTGAIARLMAWKLGRYYRNPKGTTVLTSEGHGTSRYAAGVKVTVNVISGHRDMGFTECPGQYLYAKIPTIRSVVASLMGAGLVAPSISSSNVAYGGAPLGVTFGVLRVQSWTLEIRARCTQRLMRTLTGTASPASRFATAWDLRGQDGRPVRPGVYDIELTSASPGSTARPWTSAVSVLAANSSPPPLTAVTPPGVSSYVPVTPARLYDSRSTGLPLAQGAGLDLTVLGVRGIPTTGVAAVALNVTATCPSVDTSVIVWPAGQSRTHVQTVNVRAGGTTAGLAVSPVGHDGKVSFLNLTGSTDLTVDVSGYYLSATSQGSLFHVTPAFRAVDSRSGAGPLSAGASRTITVPSMDGVDATAMSAVVVNITSLGSVGSGWLTAYPFGAASAGTSTINYGGVGPVANRAVVRLAGGRFTLTAGGAATDYLIDVVGWYAPGVVLSGRTYQALTPVRVLDTRAGTGAAMGPLGSSGTLGLTVAGVGRPVPVGASAVVMRLTGVGATRPTYVTAWPSGPARPPTSDLNIEPAVTTSNLVVVGVGTSGKIDLYNANGSTHLVADVVGYYL